LAGPLVVGAVRLRGVGVAAAAGIPAAGHPVGDGAGQGEGEVGEAGGDLSGDGLRAGLLGRGGRHAVILAAEIPHSAHSVKYKCCMDDADAAVAAYIGRWRPSSVSPEAAAFARAVITAAGPGDRERAKKPYSPAQIAGFLALADAQPTAERRMRAAGLVCLGAGAGLIRGDLRQARGTDVTCRSGGVIVTVRGARPRTVPVLSRYHGRLLAAARFAGAALICGGTDPGRRNITNPLVAALDGGTGLPRLDTRRLRATWLAD